MARPETAWIRLTYHTRSAIPWAQLLEHGVLGYGTTAAAIASWVTAGRGDQAYQASSLRGHLAP
jgi:hypothetical protein